MTQREVKIFQERMPIEIEVIKCEQTESETDEVEIVPLEFDSVKSEPVDEIPEFHEPKAVKSAVPHEPASAVKYGKRKALVPVDYFLEEQLKNDCEQNHKCDICGRVMPSNTQLLNHMRSHNGERSYKCGICEKCFTTSNGLEHHHYIHHYIQTAVKVKSKNQTQPKPTVDPTKRPIPNPKRQKISNPKPEFEKCKICGFNFIEGTFWENHMITIHNIEKPYEWQLERHLNEQTAEKLDKCDEFDFSVRAINFG